ncbi:hypothetical protein FRC03_001873 [Tulasnella sp. 419]|nr:hypothetical protein FRC03_001873 [Tulasnella sp. 419]
MCHTQRYELEGDPKDCQVGVTYYRLAYLGSPPGSQLELSILNDLLVVSISRYRKEGDIQDYYQAKQCRLILLSRQKKLDFRLERPKFIQELLERQTENSQNLDNLLVYCRDTLPICPDNEADRFPLLDNLQDISLNRYFRLGALEELERSIQCQMDKLELFPPEDGNYTSATDRQARCHVLHDLSVSLGAKFKRDGNIQTLEACINYSRDSLIDHPDRVAGKMNLAYCLLLRYNIQENTEDIEEAFNLLKTSLQQCAPEYPKRCMLLSHLALCYHAHYHRHNGVQELEEAIHYFEEALPLFSSTMESHPSFAATLANLAESLRARYALLRNPQDLSSAILYFKRALSLMSPGDPNRMLSSGGLGACLRAEYQRSQNTERLKEAIAYLMQAVEGHSPGHADFLGIAHELAVALHIHSQVEDSQDEDGIQELEMAVQLLRVISSQIPPEHPNRPKACWGLANCLKTRYERHGEIQDLSDVIQCFSDAVQCTPPDHPQITSRLAELASAYADYSHLLGSSIGCEDVTGLFRKAVDHRTAGAGDRFAACLKWIKAESGDSLLEAYQKSFELADRFILVQSSLTLRHGLLTIIPPFHSSDAARAAILAGDLEKAVEFSEQGRNLLWSQMSRYRAPLQRLHDIKPELADEFTRLSQQLEQSVSLTSMSDTSRRLSVDEARKYRRLSDEWDDVVEKIRGLDGFSNFLMPPSYATLKQAAANGPVILVNISSSHSDAIIVREKDDAAHVSLPNIGQDDIVQLYLQLIRITNEAGSRQKLLGILRCLWDDIVEPIVCKLQELGIPHRSRIWWCPTFYLAMLPLHAAGPHRKKRANLPDLYISSYTSTLSSLISPTHVHAATHRSNLSSPNLPKLLVVAHPEAPNQPPLSWVREEVQRIQQLAPSVTVLEGDSGVHNAVITSLQKHPWIHFTCHGSQNLEQPFESCFHLHDKPLTLLDIIKARLPNAQYAFLSACHSAAGDLRRPNEAIHLAAALQFCGFHSVVGTMYAMADVDGPILAEEVYKFMFRKVRNQTGMEGVNEGVVDYRDAAEALSVATKALRDRGVPLERWINFVHIGA